MTSRSTRSRRWVSGTLKTVRAAAFLTLATGINGTIAALYPKYEPIYVYLTAIIVIAWISSLLLGVTAAVAAVVIYDSMFSPVRGVPSAAMAVPLVIAVAAAIGTRVARVPVMRRAEIPPTPPPPLLEPAPHIVSITPSAPTMAADAERLADLQQQLGEARADREREIQKHNEVAAGARLRHAALQQDLDAARNEIVAAMRLQASLRQELEAARNEGSAERARHESLQQELDAARREAGEAGRRAESMRAELEGAVTRANRASVRIAELEQRAAELVQEVDAAWRKVDEEKTHAAREVELRRQLEHAATERLEDARRQADLMAAEKLQEAVAEISTRYQTPLNEAKARLAQAFTRIPQLESERDQVMALLTRERSAREQLESAGGGRMQATIAELSAKHEQALAEARAALETEKKRAEERINAATIDRDMTLTEMRSLARELESVEQKLGEARGLLETERRRAAEETAKRTETEKEFDQRLQSIVTNLTSDYEETIGEATIEKEAAKAETRALAKKLESLQEKVRADRKALLQARLTEKHQLEEKIKLLTAELQTEVAERERIAQDFDSRIQSIVAGITSDQEEAIGEATIEKEAAKAEARALQKRLDAVNAALQAEKEKHEAAVKEFDARIQSIAAGLTTDQEEAIGQATIEKEAARAEARALRNRLEAVNADLQAETAKREGAALEFDARIQSIVTGLTTDHENAIAEAMLEKEAARAEARTAAARIEALQKKLGDFDALRSKVEENIAGLRQEVETERRRADEEKAARVRAESNWGQRLQTMVSHLTADHEANLGEVMMEKEAAKAEARALSAEVTALQQKLARMGQTPAAPANQAKVLIVHSDAGMRAMAKHALESAGYAVVTAADGLEGLRVAAAQHPHAVVAEALMPKMNGRELIQLLKSRPETASMKIVLMSASGGDLERGTDFRADDVVTNPQDLDTLRATIDRVVGR